MAKKKITKEQLDEALSLYSDYFNEINQTYDELLGKAKSYLETTEKNINTLANLPQGTRGAQHYLSESIENASSLVSQCQSITDSKYKLKKSVMEYAIKDISGVDESSNENISKVVGELIQLEKEKQKEYKEKLIETDFADLDAQIEVILSKQKENN